MSRVRWPFRELIEEGPKTIDLATALFLGLVALGWLATLIAAVFPQFWLEREHLKHGFPVFAATQIVPFMYTGEHSFQITFIGEVDPVFQEACTGRAEGLRQHVPVGILFMHGERQVFANCASEAEVELRSTLRHHETTSRWKVRRLDSGYSVDPL